MRQSQTIILLFCNSTPIIWFRNIQNSVGVSVFRSEFTSMENAVKIIEALTYTMCMFGVPVNGATNIFCDNRADCVNTKRQK